MVVEIDAVSPISGSVTAKFPVIPDYRGACLSNVVPALLGPRGATDWLPAPAVDAKAVVLLLIDGIGWEHLQDRAHKVPVLASMEGGPITTVAPTTTTTAMTSLVTGASPGEHALIGYQVYIEGKVMNSLRWTVGAKRDDVRKEIVPEQTQTVPAFFGRRVPTVSRKQFHGSGFTRAHLDGVEHQGYNLSSAISTEVGALIDDGAPLVYAYYDGPDRVAHEYGLGPYLDGEYARVDQLVESILAALPPEAALLVVSDHGQVQVGDGKITLDLEMMQQVSITSGEARFCWLHARSGRANELLRIATDLYGTYGLVVSKQQVLDEGWFGLHVTPEARSRMGDVALVPREPVAFIEYKPPPEEPPEPDDPTKFELIGRHGSLTSSEVLVPCLAAYGTRS